MESQGWSVLREARGRDVGIREKLAADRLADWTKEQKALGSAAKEAVILVQSPFSEMTILPFIESEITSCAINIKRIKSLLRAKFGSTRATEKDRAVKIGTCQFPIPILREPEFFMVVAKQNEMHAGSYAVPDKLIAVFH